MAQGINKVILIGNLGGDPEQRSMPSGGSVTNVTVATTERWKDKQTGNEEKRTEWHKVVFFGRLAEIAGQYLRKGTKVYIEGSLRTRQYEKDGQKRYATEIVAKEMQMLDGRQDNQQGAQQHGGYQQQPQYSSSLNQNGSQQSPHAPPPQQGGNMDDFDDDIPFR